MPKLRICATTDLAEGSSRGFCVGGDSIFAIHKESEFYIYRNSCPHLGVELNWLPDQFLDFDGQLIQCATHGALFLIKDGHCVGGPCYGEFLEAMSYEIINGIIYLVTAHNKSSSD